MMQSPCLIVNELSGTFDKSPADHHRHKMRLRRVEQKAFHVLLLARNYQLNGREEHWLPVPCILPLSKHQTPLHSLIADGISMLLPPTTMVLSICRFWHRIPTWCCRLQMTLAQRQQKKKP